MSTESKSPDTETPSAQGPGLAAPICCAWCGNELDAEEAENPIKRSGLDDIICDRCYREEYEDECDRCGEIVEKDELGMKPGELLAFWQEVEGLKPGYYRVLHWPIYADGMICSYVYKDALEYFAPLDERGKQAADRAYTPGGRLCCTCRVEIDKHNIQASNREPEAEAGNETPAGDSK